MGSEMCIRDRTAIEIQRYAGTVKAVREQVETIYKKARIEEWFSYGGTPGFWKLYVDITDDQETYHTAAEMEKLLGYTKRCTAHLEHIIYTIEPHERSPAYIAAAPSGMATSCTVKVPGRIKPREIGAKMLVRTDGSIVGSVGGGIMEHRTILAAQEMLTGAAPAYQRLHFSADGKNDDAAIAACGGSMEIVLTRLQPGEEIK